MVTPTLTTPTPNSPIIPRCKECDNKMRLPHCKIQCEICLSFFHSKCSIKTKDYQILTNSNIGWMCNFCRSNIFPLHNVETREEFEDALNDNIYDKLTTMNKKMKCNGCNAKIKKNFPALFCKSCNMPFHIKCSKSSNKFDRCPNSWECSQCSLKALPFSSTDQNTFLLSLSGSSEAVIESLDKVPSFSLQSLLDDIPGQRFNTDEFLSNTIKSRYYNSGEFVHQKFPQNKFSIIHLNIASLQKHIDELRA